MVYIIGTVGGLLLTAYAAKLAKDVFITSQRKRAAIREDGNDDNRAVESFIDLLAQAHSEMTIYDDGNRMPGSIYMNGKVIEAIKNKLDAEPGFIMRCYFNYDIADTLFRQTFDHDEPRIEIRSGGYTPETRPPNTHYKIIDGGRMAYLSQHGHDSSERKFQLVDCTKVNRLALRHVTDELLGEYKEDMKQKFLSA